MAQIAIREFDVKRMFAYFTQTSYNGIQIREFEDVENLDTHLLYAIKPDMLFGKRGKRGLVGIQLNTIQVKSWLEKFLWKTETIDGVNGTLDVMLAEPMQEIVSEFYISFSQTREYEMFHFSEKWGIEIEENWDSVESIHISYSENLEKTQLEILWISDKNLQEYILQLWNFYKNYGFVSLECNPIAKIKSWDFIMIDAVAKIDDCEAFRQKDHWKNLEFPNTYGFKENPAEKYIRQLDSETGASLKLKILNTNAQIWTLFAGGGWSLVMSDTLWFLGFAHEIWNYGELSGNPTLEFTREYTRTLFTQMLQSQSKNKYLIIAGAIANFTDIATTFEWIIDILEEFQKKIQQENIQILVRRWGINEKKWLKILQEACEKLQIPTIITGSETYMTNILKEIKL